MKCCLYNMKISDKHNFVGVLHRRLLHSDQSTNASKTSKNLVIHASCFFTGFRSYYVLIRCRRHHRFIAIEYRTTAIPIGIEQGEPGNVNINWNHNLFDTFGIVSFVALSSINLASHSGCIFNTWKLLKSFSDCDYTVHLLDASRWGTE